MPNSDVAPLLSVVIPIYNEIENLPVLYSALTKTLGDAALAFELIFVDDGSSDGSDEIIRHFSQQDPRVRYARFTRNFGHEAASTCGFRMVRGQCAVLMDADMQDPPEVILEMLNKWREGYQIVYARRLARDGETAAKKFTSHLFYRIINLFSETEIPVDVGDFRLVDREVVASFNCLTERNRFVRGLISWLGYSQTCVDYQRPPRKSGSTKYNLLKLIFLSMDAIFGFSLAPLRICILIGLGVISFSFVMVAVIVFQRLFLGLEIPGYALLTTGMFFLGGMQLTFLGVIGEYVGKIFREVQARPLYLVGESSDANTT